MTMRTRVRVAALTALAVGGSVVSVPPATAASETSSYKSSAATFDQCGEGATCTVDVSATRAGEHSGSASVHRPEPTSTNDMAFVVANAEIPLHLRKPVPELRVTFAWRVHSADARTAPTSAEGVSVARLFLDGEVIGCSTCELTYEATGGSARGHYGNAAIDLYSARVGETTSLENHDATYTVIMRGPGGTLVPAGRYTLRGQTRPVAAVGKICIVEVCGPEAFGHSGSAAVDVRASLTSITVA